MPYIARSPVVYINRVLSLKSCVCRKFGGVLVFAEILPNCVARQAFGRMCLSFSNFYIGLT